MGIPSRCLSILAVAVVLAAPARPEDDGEVTTIAGFEQPETEGVFLAGGGVAERVELPDGGHAVRWRLPASEKGGWLDFQGLPNDLRPYRVLRFRARMVGDPAAGKPDSGKSDAGKSDAGKSDAGKSDSGKPGKAAAAEDGGEVYVRIANEGGLLEARLPDLGPEWRLVEILLPEMRLSGAGFSHEKEQVLIFICFKSGGFTIEFDDLALLKEGDGWRYSGPERRAMGGDPAMSEFLIGAFERPRELTAVSARRSTATLEPVEGWRKRQRNEGQALRWTIPASEQSAWIDFSHVPGDIREYRFLRFAGRLQAESPKKEELYLRLISPDGRDSSVLDGLSEKWQDYEVPLPKFDADEKFDPKKVILFRFVHFGDAAITFEVDDLRLVKGSGGWQRTAEENIAWIFGEKRRRKVKTIETDHFEVFTDSKAARSRFPKALEKTYDFVCESLGLEGDEHRLPVYIFQSSTLYHDFCVRRGWSRQAAVETAGHANADYFATYYQSPESAVVAHELTHSIFHRCRGVGGGSWFQEGVATYVEDLWQSRSAAELFAPRLRSGEYVPLSEFVLMGSLAHYEDAKGGARRADMLYAQAGAFFEFMYRGPLAKERPELVSGLAQIERSGDHFKAKLAELFGAPLDTIEKRWVEWGSEPPEPVEDGRKRK